MSTAYAIGAVTAVLKKLLEEVLGETALATALNTPKVTVRAPDQIDLTAAPNTAPLLNLFLYHVQPNAARRNLDLPSFDAGGARTAVPALALDLHYLVTAYASTDFHAETLLGHTALFFHDTPLLTAARVRPILTALTGGTSNLGKLLGNSRLAEQIEHMRITANPLSIDEMSKVWTALQSRYRPSIAYQVSVVLLESERPARAAMPVLRREIDVIPSLDVPYPALTAIELPNRQPAIRDGETLTLPGHDLAGDTVNVRFENARSGAVQTIVPATATANEITVVIAGLPAGGYAVSVEIKKGDAVRGTNALPVAVAPKFGLTAPPETIDVTPSTDAKGNRVIDVASVTPPIEPQQQVSLIIGNREAPMTEITAPTTKPRFVFLKATAPAAGTSHYARIRVDGVESLLVKRDPPSFDETQKIKIP